jgi:Xaa-Pro aminopeptidase
VLTCEPGLYIREENIGIRIENNILVTKDGPVNLTKQIPVTVEEIEGLMNA